MVRNNGFDEAVLPPEVAEVVRQHSGLATRVRQSAILGWDLSFPGRLSNTSKRKLRAFGYKYQSRKWCKWDR